ncbi:MAG: hypothetical protein AABY22_23145, partial [Nanoarchaeota archaeon]
MLKLVLFITLLSLIEAFNLCSYHNTDLCIGISGANVYAGQLVQLKSRLSNLSNSSKIDWEYKNATFSKVEANETLFLDKETIGTTALLARKTNGLILSDDGKIYLNRTNLCLSLMKCDAGPGGFCNSAPKQKVAKYGDLKKGSYLQFKVCDNSTLSLAQSFEIDPPCSRNCSNVQLNNTVCDEACNIKECFYDYGRCNSTAPT